MNGIFISFFLIKFIQFLLLCQEVLTNLHLILEINSCIYRNVYFSKNHSQFPLILAQIFFYSRLNLSFYLKILFLLLFSSFILLLLSKYINTRLAHLLYKLIDQWNNSHLLKVLYIKFLNLQITTYGKGVIILKTIFFLLTIFSNKN